jgi:hypothetical protein
VLLVAMGWQFHFASALGRGAGATDGGERIPDEETRMAVPVAADEFKLATYNVENLFDAQHDLGKLDHTFLPTNHPDKAEYCNNLSTEFYKKQCLQTNWTNEKVRWKLGNIRKALAEQGPLPDFLAVQEIENERVAGALAKTLGYDKFLITNSPDERGIDVALLYNESKFVYVDHAEIDVSDRGLKTRNILRAHFRPRGGVGGLTLGLFVNHWPSQSKGPRVRETVAKRLAAEIDRQTDRIGADKYFVVVAGDLNTTQYDYPHAVVNVMTSPFWGNGLVDAQDVAEMRGNPMRYKMPPMSYFFAKNGTWDRFDRILLSRNFLVRGSGIEFVPHSYRIVGTAVNTRPYTYNDRAEDFYLRTQRVPLRFDTNAGTAESLGFSDHFPVVTKFRLGSR